MRGPVVDWDLQELLKEYENGEKLTEEEDRKLEEQLNKYMYEFAMNEMKEENEMLKAQVEEMTEKADMEKKKREEAEEERRRGQETIEMLRRSLVGMDVTRTVSPSRWVDRRSRRSRERCWDLARPGGCRYGARCRYLHPEVEVVRAEEGYSSVEGECRFLGFEEQMRRRQEQDFREARVRVREVRGGWTRGWASQPNQQGRSEQLYQQQLYQQQMYQQQLYQQQLYQQQLYQQEMRNQQQQWMVIPTLQWLPQM